MKRPFCRIAGKEYQLYKVNGVIRFENLNVNYDYNGIWIKYYKGEIKLEEVLKSYVTSGCSYELVYGCFSKCGINSENILQGSEKPYKFELYRELKPKN